MSLFTEDHNEPFYNQGLQFECLKCGNCCSGFPGFVYLSHDDINTICNFLGIDNEQFVVKYTRPVHLFGQKRLSLTEKPDYDCIFWDRREKLCTIYKARPYQCRSYPFWKSNLISEREWKRVENFCPGINRGRVYSTDEIERFLKETPDYNLKNLKLPDRFYN